MDSLADLRDLIIGRIEEVRRVPAEIASVLSNLAPAVTIEAELQINRAIIRLLTALKRKEKERVEAEDRLLEEIKSLRFLTTRIIEEVYTCVHRIFAAFDPSFCTAEKAEHTTSDQLRRLFLRFFEKHQLKGPSQNVFKMLSHPISETTPFILLGWVSEWARLHFMESTQAAIGSEFARHEEEMRRVNSQRSPPNTVVRDKSMSPFSNSTSLPRTELTPPSLTNKESVYGLFLDQLTHYYKAMPSELDLDMGFVKSMKNLRPKGNQFQQEETLQRAAEILIDAKNKTAREQIAQFITQCGILVERTASPIKVKHSEKSMDSKARNNIQIREKSPRKKQSPFQKFFERVKSESKQDGMTTLTTEKRNSLLLCPKANQISFESSREIMRKLQREKLRKEFELPEIAPNRVLSTCAPSAKGKQKNPFFEPNHSMIGNYERYERTPAVPLVSYEFKQPLSKEKPQEKQRKARLEIQDNPQALRQEGEELRRNRKMMLQLLREKNRHAFLDQ